MSECVKGCGRRASRRGMCSLHYNTRRERDIAYGRWKSGYVDAEPARRHALALRAAGMGRRRLAAISGVSDSVIHVLINGRPERGTPPSRRIAAGNARAILAVPIPDVSLLAAGARVDITGTARRLQSLVSLVAAGYTQADLAGRLGISQANSTALFHGQGLVLAATALRVADLYDRLSMTAGPSHVARERARKLGWPPPLAWDDDTIDNLDAQPDIGERRTVPFLERYGEMRDLGLGQDEIAARMGVARESLLRQLDRHGASA